MKCLVWVSVLLLSCSGDTMVDDAGTDGSTHDVIQHDVQFIVDSPVDTGPPWDGAFPVTCTTTDQDAGADGGSSPSFMNDVTPIFAACGGELCHTSTSGAAWPYDSLVNVKTSRDSCPGANFLVVPSSLSQSYLMNKITGLGMCPSTAQMPSGKSPLTMSQMQTIADWICQGAQDN
jgi:hypothetical protein